MLRTISCISFLIWLSSCVSVPDVPFGCRANDGRWTEKKDDFGIAVREFHPNPVCMKEIGEPECGFCSWTVSDKTQYVGEAEKTHIWGKPWSQIKLEAFVVPSESVEKLKAFVVKMCHENKGVKGCDQISKWRIKLDAIDDIDDAFLKKPTAEDPAEYRLAPHSRL